MTTVPRLSIGLPVYNGESLLPKAIEALLGQSYKDFELIISDNASTDGTAAICQAYEVQDSRVRHIRQPRNIGLVPNHNFLVGVARGEFFKWASYDDLYDEDYLQRCVDALDEHRGAVLAHSWCVVTDYETGKPIRFSRNPEGAASPQAVDRFRSLLLDGMGDWVYGVVRTNVLRRTPLQPSHHNGEWTLIAELALHGRLYQVHDWLYFRRDHPGRDLSPRRRSTLLDPRRSSSLRHPAVRLYAEYLWGYISAIWRDPLSRAEKRECYRNLVTWLVSRAAPASPARGAEVSFGTQPLIYLVRGVSGLLLGPSRAPESSPRWIDAEVAGIKLDPRIPGRKTEIS